MEEEKNHCIEEFRERRDHLELEGQEKGKEGDLFLLSFVRYQALCQVLYTPYLI